MFKVERIGQGIVASFETIYLALSARDKLAADNPQASFVLVYPDTF